MLIKEIISEKILTLAEAKEILEGLIKKGGEGQRQEQEEEMRYEKRKVLGHTTKFGKTDARKSKLLVEELLGLEKMNEEIAVTIANIMPKSENEVRAIYAKEKFTLIAGDIEKILDCVAKYE